MDRTITSCRATPIASRSHAANGLCPMRSPSMGIRWCPSEQAPRWLGALRPRVLLQASDRPHNNPAKRVLTLLVPLRRRSLANLKAGGRRHPDAIPEGGRRALPERGSLQHRSTRPPGNSRPGRSGWTAGPRDGGDQLLLLRCDRQPRHYHGSSRVFNPSKHVMHSINATHQMMVLIGVPRH